MKSNSLHSRFRSSPVRERIFTLIAIAVAIAVVIAVIGSAGLIQVNYPAKGMLQQRTSDHAPENFGRTFEQQNQVQSKLQETELSLTMQIARTTYLPNFNYPELEHIEAMENLSPADGFNRLQQLRSHQDPVIRLAAIESIANMKYPGIASILITAMRDPNPQIRIEALEGLALQNEAASVAAIAPYLFDSDQQVRIVTIDSLSEINSEAAVIALASLLSDGDVVVRRHTINALGEMGGENAILYLLEARYDPDETIRANAEAILFELGHKADY